MEILQDFIPQGRGNRPGYAMTPAFVTIHDTANENRGADAVMHGKYLKGDSAASAPVSWHFTVDDRQIVQHLPLNENGWHCGDGGEGPGNRTSLGIEITENSDGDRAKAEANAARLAADLLGRFGLGIDAVVQHYRWNGKNCPRVLRARPGGWEGFLAAVNQFLEARPIDASTPIIGQAVATLAQARTWLQQKAPAWVEMADLYYGIAPRYGIRPDVALCQATKETAFFRFGGIVMPDQNNFAGLAATGTPNPSVTPEEYQKLLRGADPARVKLEPGRNGATFTDRATGVEAQIQHLYAYATADALPAGTVLLDPRFVLVRRGSARFVEHLGAAENPTGVGWAYPGKDYGKSIVRDFLTPMASVQVPVSPDNENEQARSRVTALTQQVEALTAERDKYRALVEKIREWAKEV